MDGTTIQDRYPHPNANQGVESHRFHRENLNQVKGSIFPLTDFPEEDRILIQNGNDRISKPLTPNELELLRRLQVKPVLGLPFMSDHPDKFVHANSFFINNSSTTQT